MLLKPVPAPALGWTSPFCLAVLVLPPLTFLLGDCDVAREEPVSIPTRSSFAKTAMSSANEQFSGKLTNRTSPPS